MEVYPNEISSDACDGGVVDVIKPDIRIWMDGAFDMMHYGHMNAFRQAKGLGTTLVVGVNNDESITICKGKPVTSEEERMETVRGCKWVDEIVTDVPYIMNEEYLKNMMQQHRIDFVVHGDDPCIVDGKDVYETAQKLGKYLTIPRTEGISTTAIVGRILSHLQKSSSDTSAVVEPEAGSSSSASRNSNVIATLYHGKSSFLTTGSVIRLFSENIKAPVPGARVVYIGGTWDLLHAGHLSVLEKAKARGDYLIVGIYSNHLASVLHSRSKEGKRGGVSSRSSSGWQGGEGEALYDHTYPILSMEERMLSILGCKYVDDVLLDAPYVLSSDLLSSLRISIVLTECAGSENGSAAHQADIQQGENGTDTGTKEDDIVDPNKIPREMNILHSIAPSFSITGEEIMDRILKQEEKFKKKFAAKRAQEDEYYAALYGKRNRPE